jgi:hypothetical protein
MDTKAFLEVLNTTIRASIASVRNDRLSETLAGFALLTDDGVQTLYGAALTKEALTSSPDPEVMLFVPTEWPLEPERQAFNALGAKLRESEPTDEASFEAHVDSSFAILVTALAETRAEGLFAPEVFLTVTSTDPSDYMNELATAAIARLNEAGLVNDRERFIQKWALPG